MSIDARNQDMLAIEPAATGATIGGMPPSEIPGRPTRLTRYEGKIIGGVAVVVALLAWQGVAAARIWSPLFLPGPLDVLAAFRALIKEGSIWNDMLVSGKELLYGYVLAVVVSLPLGIIMGWYRRINALFDPFVIFFYNTPRIALAPLLIVWFGIGIYSKIALVFLGAFFPIVINTIAGMRNLDPSLLKAARSFCASDAKIFRTVALPGSVPFILTGLRLGVAHAVIGVVVGELIAAQAGLGLMMATAGATFQTPKVFVGIIIFSVAGVVLNYALLLVERRFQSWRPSHGA
jgi:ABC-type nitrate/sulfonate/bicarbonate transport system permease component